jgi:hypothetical protein
MDNLACGSERLHGAGNADPMGAGQKAQVFMGQWELDHGPLKLIVPCSWATLVSTR